MESNINIDVLRILTCHYNKFGLKYRLKGLPYERCGELSWIIGYLKPQFSEEFRYLDIGTGESPLPTFLHAHTPWQITCLDKCSWVRKQHTFHRKILNGNVSDDRFRVIESDLQDVDFSDEQFDVITCVSVIEHFAGVTDSAAMTTVARLLRPGGVLILTTPVNDPFFMEFFVEKPVYGDLYNGSPVFYQRHYDVASIERRLLQPSGLSERLRVYFGDYGFQCFERVLQQPKLLRALYAWRTPWLAARFLSYRSYPVSRPSMRMNTASGTILVLEKTASLARPTSSGTTACVEF